MSMEEFAMIAGKDGENITHVEILTNPLTAESRRSGSFRS
jgi:hypothetical protein